jgi:glycosyltransferase involved in cell wall biosynthesis
MFDFHSTIGRKNPFATLEAFKRAFAQSNEDVLLVLKFSNGNFFPKERDQLKAQAAGWPVHFIDGHLKREELHALVANCDCYVSLHRAEGFGLTMAEAMYYGKPVIATGYSSNMEFMNVGNSFPVKYDIVTLTEDYGPYFKGNYWADPHIDHAASLMQYVFENPQEAQQVGARAAQEIKSLLSPQLLGTKIKNRLEIIRNRMNQSTNWSTRIHQMQQETALAQCQTQVWRQTTQQVQSELAQHHRLAKT